MVEIAIISDTHVPSRATRIPEWVEERIRSADHTIHAGDFDSEDAYETVVDLADGDLTAARGNTDPLSLGLPEVAAVELADTTFVVTHGTGSQSGYRERVLNAVREATDDPAVSVSGHTHEVMDEEVEGIRMLNPGSATGVSPAEKTTMMSVELEQGKFRVDVHET